MDRYRLIYVGLGLLLAVLVAVVAVLLPSGERSSLPEPIDRIFPLPGDAVVRQTVIEVDLAIGYEMDLFVDGRLVPPFEVDVTEETGLRMWQPGPGRSMVQWIPGEHTVRVAYRRTTGLPDVGEYEWAFRVQ